MTFCKIKLLNKKQQKTTTRGYTHKTNNKINYVRIWFLKRLLLCRIGIQNLIVIIREHFDQIMSFCHP